jgi:hypothetical protein
MGITPVIGVRHPDAVVLRHFALGSLDRTTTDLVEGHLLNCDACCRIVLATPDDRLLMLLRRIPGLSTSRIEHALANRA